MKRLLWIAAAAVLFLSTVVVPTAVRADGGGNGGTSCGNTLCKP